MPVVMLTGRLLSETGALRVARLRLRLWTVPASPRRTDGGTGRVGSTDGEPGCALLLCVRQHHAEGWLVLRLPELWGDQRLFLTDLWPAQ